MTDPQATLLLTRPAESAAAFLSQCETAAGRRLPVVIAPLIRIADTGELPNLDRFETIIATSRNAIRRLSHSAVLRGRRIATVGEKTAELARCAGADARSLGPDIDSFLEKSDELLGPCIHCRGVHTRGNLAVALTARGIETHEAVIYDQIAIPLSGAARVLIAGTAPVVAPLFSPRTAALLAASPSITAPLTVIAMSDAVANAWSRPGKIAVAREPTSAAMVEATMATI